MGRHGTVHQAQFSKRSVAAAGMVAAGAGAGAALALQAPALLLAGAIVLAVAASLLRFGTVATASIAMLVLAATPLPAGLPVAYPVGGGTLLLADLVAVALVVAALLTGSRRVVVTVTASLLLGGVGLLIGVAHGFDGGAAVRDVRGVGHGLAVLLGSLVLLERDTRRAMRLGGVVVTAIVLWSSVASLVGLGIGGEWLNGRLLDAALYGGAATGSVGATRLLVVSGPLCAATAAACLLALGWQRIEGVRRAWLLGVLAASLVVLLLTYSRNNLVTVVTAAGISVLLGRHRPLVVGRLTRGLASVAACVVPVVAVAAAASEGVRRQLGVVWAAFSARVLHGLDPDVLTLDASALWRREESALALAYSLENPLTGSGLGVPYRSVQPGEPFSGTDGTTYVHSTFLWVPVKLGWVVAMVLLVMVIAGLVRRWRSAQDSSSARIALGTLLALTPAMAVAPLPFASASGVVLGFLGALCLSRTGDSMPAGGLRRSGPAQVRGTNGLPEEAWTATVGRPLGFQGRGLG